MNSPSPGPGCGRDGAARGRRGIIAALTAALALGAVHPATAQSGGGFELWSGFAAGGGVVAGGGFSINGAVGVNVADGTSGGGYEIAGGWGGPIGTVGAPGAAAIPSRFALLAPEPNPSSGVTTVRFELPHAAVARLAVFDLHGRCVARLVDAALTPGRHTVPWSGRSAAGERLAGGIYFVRLDAAEFHGTSRIVLVP